MNAGQLVNSMDKVEAELAKMGVGPLAVSTVGEIMFAQFRIKEREDRERVERDQKMAEQQRVSEEPLHKFESLVDTLVDMIAETIRDVEERSNDEDPLLALQATVFKLNTAFTAAKQDLEQLHSMIEVAMLNRGGV